MSCLLERISYLCIVNVTTPRDKYIEIRRKQNKEQKKEQQKEQRNGTQQSK